MNRPQMTKRNRSRFVRNRKPSVRPSARLEQALYEMMEPRRVLNGVPVINPDPQYFTDVSTAVSITTNDQFHGLGVVHLYDHRRNGD